MKGKAADETFPPPLLESDGASAELVRRFVRLPPPVPSEAAAWHRTSARLGQQIGRRRSRVAASGAAIAVAGALALALTLSPDKRADGPRPRALTASTATPRPLTARSLPKPTDDVRLIQLRKYFGGRELLSRIYVVFWPDGRAFADALDDRPCWPEVALL